MFSRLKDVFSSFQKPNVRRLVIGGITVVLHGVPPTTSDLEILIEANDEDARRLLNALEDSQSDTASLIRETMHPKLKPRKTQQPKIQWRGNRIVGCQSTNHTACRGELWECERCHKIVCWEEGTTDMPELCDDCWCDVNGVNDYD